MGLRKIFNVKMILFIVIIIATGYLSSQYPDEAILIGGCAIVLIIGIWLLQVTKENE